MNTQSQNLISSVICGMPLILYAYVLLFWLAASASLGQWAQPSIHDPKGFFYGIPATFGGLLLLLSFAVIPLVIFIGYKRKKLLIHLVTYGLCLGIGVFLFSLNWLQITTWIAD